MPEATPTDRLAAEWGHPSTDRAGLLKLAAFTPFESENYSHCRWEDLPAEVRTRVGLMFNSHKTFRVEGWGECGYANLEAFVPFPGHKCYQDLEVGETSEGKLQKPGSDHKPERITRIR